MDARFEITAPMDEKVFILVGTSETVSWSNNRTPFLQPMTTFKDFTDQGFDTDDFIACQELGIGKVYEDTDFEGIYIMRVQ